MLNQINKYYRTMNLFMIIGIILLFLSIIFIDYVEFFFFTGGTMAVLASALRNESAFNFFDKIINRKFIHKKRKNRRKRKKKSHQVSRHSVKFKKGDENLECETPKRINFTLLRGFRN